MCTILNNKEGTSGISASIKMDVSMFCCKACLTSSRCRDGNRGYNGIGKHQNGVGNGGYDGIGNHQNGVGNGGYNNIGNHKNGIGDR